MTNEKSSGFKVVSIDRSRFQIHTESFIKTYSASYSITDFLNLFLFLWVIVAILDPDPDSESASGSTDLNEFRSNPDPDPKHWLKVEFTQRREILI
jgi:hypothetical protein